MLTKNILLAALTAIASVNAGNLQGFNYGSTRTDGSGKAKADFQEEFLAAQKLPGTNGKFTSARLYTMIQAGTASDPISAIEAAIDTQTSLLLGMWCSAGQQIVTNEITALTTAIKKYGEKFTNLVVGLSIGSEDLYRNSPMGIEAGSNPGANPSDLVSYIGQVRKALAGTPLNHVEIGHVDTWTGWVNGSNSAVVDAVDWLGFDAYPYFQSTMPNSIDDANSLFWQAYDNTNSVSKGKPVWITETGWPISGKTFNLAKADVPSAQAYWNSVGCEILGNYNTFWYTLRDADPTTPNPSFGLVGPNFGKPYYDLSCKGQSTVRPSPTVSASGKATGTGAASSHGSTFAVTSSGSEPTSSDASASDKPSSAVSSKNLQGATGVLAIQLASFLVAAMTTAFFAF